jgi:hypothetical protein
MVQLHEWTPTKQNVEAAVLARYSGATIVRTETNGDSSAPYESHIACACGALR